jgi:hypothetical protein
MCTEPQQESAEHNERGAVTSEHYAATAAFVEASYPGTLDQGSPQTSDPTHLKRKISHPPITHRNADKSSMSRLLKMNCSSGIICYYRIIKINLSDPLTSTKICLLIHPHCDARRLKSAMKSEQGS